MDQCYLDWISENVSEVLGTCKQVTLGMLEAFPDLTRVRGHYYCIVWGERQHWWLVDSSGTVIDPTMAQFPSKGRGEYVPWDEGSIEPTGLCPHCSDLIYDGGYTHEHCATAFAASCLGSY